MMVNIKFKVVFNDVNSSTIELYKINDSNFVSKSKIQVEIFLPFSNTLDKFSNSLNNFVSML